MGKKSTTPKKFHETETFASEEKAISNEQPSRSVASLTAAAIMAIGFASSGNAAMLAIHDAEISSGSPSLPVINAQAAGGGAGGGGNGPAGGPGPGGPGFDNPRGPRAAAPEFPQTTPTPRPAVLPFKTNIGECKFERRAVGTESDRIYRVVRVCI